MNAFVSEPRNSNNSLKLLQQRIEIKYKIKFENFWEFHKWTVVNFIKVYSELWDFLGIICSEVPTDVIGKEKFEDIPKWFLGAKLNYAQNILRFGDHQLALILAGEERVETEKITFKALRDEVSVMASALRKYGISSLDVVACYMSNRKEAIVSMLAAATIGAQYSASNPLMGIKGVLSRFQQIHPKVLFTIDRHLYNKEEMDNLKILSEIVQGLPSLELVVIVPSNNKSLERDISSIPKSMFMPDFLALGLDADGKILQPRYEQLSYNHPFIINYTSGTTGPPKGVVHSAGAALLGPLITMSLMFHSTPSDVMFTMHSTGWVSWNIFVAALGCGSALLIYEGVPFFKYGTKVWDMIDEHGVTYAFFTPSTLETMEKLNLGPGSHNQLEALHTIVTGSSSVKGHTYDFVHKRIKSDVFFSLAYGSTEFMAMAYGVNYNLPVYRTEMQSPLLGLNVCCFDDEGKEIFDQSGELVITNPFPSMPLYFFNDKENKKFKETLFNKYPGVWCHGDVCTINSKTHGLVVHGRSDETIKHRGLRFGSSEMYSVVNQMEEVADCLCISHIDRDGDSVALLFLQLKDNLCWSDDFILDVKKLIRKELSLRHVPDAVFQVSDIPYNLNGKKLELLVKKIFSSYSPLSTDAVINPECLPQYFQLSKMVNDEN